MSKEEVTVQQVVKIKDFAIGNTLPFTLIAGPCAMESVEHVHFMAREISAICRDLGVNYIFKSSFDKANRTSTNAWRSLGIEKGLALLSEVREKYGIPVTTDVHEPWQCEVAAKCIDLLQLPAFLCRQTDLIVAAAQTQIPVNVKKAQFLSPYDMENVADKFVSSGGKDLMLCERGSCYGYNNLVVDFISLPVMRSFGHPVIFDATHSVQQPGGNGTSTGGRREMIPYLSRAAVAVGVAGLFLEVHDDPNTAKSDGPNMLYLKDLPALLKELIELDKLTKAQMSSK